MFLNPLEPWTNVWFENIEVNWLPLFLTLHQSIPSAKHPSFFSYWFSLCSWLCTGKLTTPTRVTRCPPTRLRYLQHLAWQSLGPDGDSASEHQKRALPVIKTLRPQTNGFCSPFNVKQSKYHVFILSMFIFVVNTPVILLGDHVPSPHLLLAARPLPISTHRRCLRCHRLHQRWPRRHPTSVDFNRPKNFGPWVEVQLRWTF